MNGRIAFESVTYALRARDELRRDKLIAMASHLEIVRLSPDQTPKGCAWGLELDRRHISRAAAILSRAGIKFSLVER